MDIPTISILLITVFHNLFFLFSEVKRWPSKNSKSPQGRRKFSNTFFVIFITKCIESICAFPQCALHNLMPAAGDWRVPGSKQMGTQSVLFLFWAPVVLSLLSTPLHAVTSPISRKEEFAKAEEIAIFCYGVTHNTGIWSH